MPSAPLTPEQEARAQQLAADLQQALADDVLTLARSLVANEQRPFGAAEFQGYRPKTPLSLLGPVRCQRAYYCCHRCGQGLCPWDEQAGLTAGRLTAGAERLVSLAGLLGDSFEEAAERTLPELCGLRV